MKVSERTIKALGQILTGDLKLTPYRSGPQLVRFFVEFGANDVYGQGFPSRWDYAEKRFRDFNGTNTMRQIVESIIDPRDFISTTQDAPPLDPGKAVEHVNKYLKYDGFELRENGGRYRVFDAKGILVDVEIPPEAHPWLNHQFIAEQMTKCDRKVGEADYDGAITNARSLLEGVLCDLISEVTGTHHKSDGDLPGLYKKVQKLMNLEPNRKDVSQALGQLLGGLANVVAGLAPLRNKMSDAHARDYRPVKHHATLAVNASKTIVDFLLESYEHQKKLGLLKPGEGSAMQ